MPLTEQHRKHIIYAFCILFYLLMLLKLSNGFLLFQLKPFLFNTRFDLVTWMLMKTGLHQLLLNSPKLWLAFDIAFYSMPLLYLLSRFKSVHTASVVAVIMLIVNFVYIQCYTLYPVNSIESFIPWLLFPFLLMCIDLRTFYFILHGLRYFFLFFCISAGIWKIAQGGLFNTGQMSGVLLYQHKEYLTSSPGYWYTNFIYWLISHRRFSYLLYLVATLLELTFAVGFFTRKYDRLLLAAFITFLLTDVLFMRIPYWEVTPFLLTFLYSRYSVPGKRYR